MDLKQYNRIVIFQQKETEKIKLNDYFKKTKTADLVMADQGESNFNPEYHEYRIMKNRFGPKVETEFFHIADIAKALLKSN